MKKTFLIAMLLSPAALMAQKGDFVLKGKIGDLNAPAKLQLMYRNGKTEIKDSAVLKNGAFEFKGTVDGPSSAMMILQHPEAPANPRGRDAIIFYVEKGTITLSSPDSLVKATFSGSPVNADNQRLEDALEPTREKNAKLYREYAAADEQTRKSKEFQEGIEKKSTAIFAEQKEVYMQFLKANPKSFVSLDALQRVAGGVPDDVAEVETLFNGLAPVVKNTNKGKEVAALINSWKKTAVGAMAPAFTQNDTLGKPVNLTDFKGKYVLIDFWASWCGPCRAENPNVVAAYNKYKDKSFTILGVSLDNEKGRDAWLKAIHKDGLTWTHVSDLKYWDNEVAKLYGVRAVPQNFLLDPSGKIIARNLRGEALEKKLAEVLN